MLAAWTAHDPVISSTRTGPTDAIDTDQQGRLAVYLTLGVPRSSPLRRGTPLHSFGSKIIEAALGEKLPDGGAERQLQHKHIADIHSVGGQLSAFVDTTRAL